MIVRVSSCISDDFLSNNSEITNQYRVIEKIKKAITRMITLVFGDEKIS
jgi:hypothetical protein